MLETGVAMKITRRETKANRKVGGRFAVSVDAHDIDEIESMINYLEKHRRKPYSRIVTALIEKAAREDGWAPDDPASAPIPR
jgi:hypothetical protein